MCGLLACWDPEVSAEQLYEASNMLSHRGVRSTVTDLSELSLRVIHWRLPINGLTPNYDHPHCAENSDFMQLGWMVGEYYNVDKEMFGSDADALNQILSVIPTEIMVQPPGMFHMLLFRSDGSLILLQDKLGKKPVYYRADKRAICSEIKPLTALGPCTPDELYYNQVLNNRLPMPSLTPYLEIIKVDPSMWYSWDLAKDTDLPQAYKYSPLPLEYCDSIGHAIETAVNTRITSLDTEYAMLLSGGLDSSLLYTIIREMGGNPWVFHIENDESKYVEMMDVPDDRLITIESDESLDNIARVLWYNESPLDLGSMLSQFALGEAIKKERPDIPVVLTGDGADELFGGYKRAQEKDTSAYDMEELRTWHLPRLDKLMMAHTLEVRSPYLDELVIEKAQSFPWESRKGKQPIKNVARYFELPEAIINREKHPLKSNRFITDRTKWKEYLVKTFRQHFERGFNPDEHFRYSRPPRNTKRHLA